MHITTSNAHNFLMRQELNWQVFLKQKKKGELVYIHYLFRFFRCNAIADIDSMETAAMLAATAKVDRFKVPSADHLRGRAAADWCA